MTLTELAQRLVEAGKDATPGPWSVYKNALYGSVISVNGHITQSRTDVAPCSADDAAFIATARDADKLATAFLRAVEMLQRLNPCDDIDWHGIEKLLDDLAKEMQP